MFTIKHIEKSGHESLSTAESVSFVPKSDDEPRNALDAFGGSQNTSGEKHSRFSSGHVYVMNEAGKTVGTYALG